VTQGTYKPNFGGLSDADAKCQQEAANLGGTFRAWLADTTGSPATRFTKQGSFVLVDGTPVASSWADLADGTLAAAIQMTAKGALVGKELAWTNVRIDGQLDSTSDHCSNWTSVSGALMGSWGDPSMATSWWTTEGAGNCGQCSYHLYCFEQ
jgi:hypothetical protein